MLRFPLSKALAPALAAALLASAIPAGELQVHFFNVDHGNAALVLGPGGTRVLIDAGLVGVGTGVVRPFLQSLGVTDLDYAINTHWDLDHYGGLPELFAGGYQPDVAVWDVGNALMPSNSVVTQYLAWSAGLRATPTVGQTIALGDGATLEVVAVNGHTAAGSIDISSSSQVDNSSSIAVVVRYGDFDCYIGGDLTAGGNFTADVEGPASSGVGQVEVALASHHGSNTSSSLTVVNNLSPSFVVQSCGADNPYGHPTKTTTNRWNSPGAMRVMWSTTRGDTTNGAGGFCVADGHISVESDGRKFRVTRSSGTEELWFTTFENPGPAPSSNSLVISELLVDPAAVADSHGEWFELSTAVAGGPFDLGGASLQSGSNQVTLHSRLLLEHGAQLVFGVDGRTGDNGDLFPSAATPWQSLGLANAGGSLRVRNASTTLVDQTSWGTGGFPVTPGIAAERINLIGGGGAGNFTGATASWAGGDLGSPGAPNGADTTPWPAALVAWPPAEVGGELALRLYSVDEAGAFYFLGHSLNIAPGFPLAGFWMPLAVDPVFTYFLSDPATFSLLLAGGQRALTWPIPAQANLAGFSWFANFITLDFDGQSFSGSKQSNVAVLKIQP